MNIINQALGVAERTLELCSNYPVLTTATGVVGFSVSVVTAFSTKSLGMFVMTNMFGLLPSIALLTFNTLLWFEGPSGAPLSAD